MRTVLPLFALVCLCHAADKAGDFTTFEVASVKLAAAGNTSGAMRGGPGTKSPEFLKYSGVTLRDVIAKAYGVGAFQVAGPQWLGSERYQIDAKVPKGATEEQLHLMLANLLSERFLLKIHREEKELSIYALVSGKDGPKVKPAAPPSQDANDGGVDTRVNGRWVVGVDKNGVPDLPKGEKMVGVMLPGKVGFRASEASMKTLAAVLTHFADRPVVDMSGLKGEYAFTLTWTPPPRPGAPSNRPSGLRNDDIIHGVRHHCSYVSIAEPQVSAGII